MSRVCHSRPYLHFFDDFVLLEFDLPHHDIKVFLFGMGGFVFKFIDILMAKDVDGVLILKEAKEALVIITLNFMLVMAVLHPFLRS